MAISLPLSLLTMLAIPFDVALSLETLVSFLLLSIVISVPFVFSGVVVCLSLTRMPFAIGRIYFADLLGASAGCLLASSLLTVLDGPSALFMVSGLLFLSAYFYSRYARETGMARRAGLGTIALILAAALNASTLYGIQPIWSKGEADKRLNLAAEAWNPISKVRVTKAVARAPQLW